MSLLTSDYISGWYFAKKNQTGSDIYYLLQNISNTTTYESETQNLIQGEAGVLVINNNGQREVTTINSEALILDNASGNNNVTTLTKIYGDVIDLFIDDYHKLLNFFFLSSEDLFIKKGADLIGFLLDTLQLNIDNKNLLSSANIAIGDIINCTLTYQTRYTNKFSLVYALDAGGTPEDFDFIARTAKNYDCRFMIDGNNYKIVSGNVNVNIGYKEVFLANSYYRQPFYNPQSHNVEGEFEIIAKHNEFNFISEEGNCSILIGDRYIELGQASVKTSYTRGLNSAQNPTTVKVNFKAYGRLGAGIDDVRWTNYFINLLMNRPGSEKNVNKILDELKNFLRGF